jgi:3-isopropylmalate/(R)-2-methylmalate dehydratase small subunit
MPGVCSVLANPIRVLRGKAPASGVLEIMNMQIRNIEGRGMALRGDGIDTDQIMPSRFLTWITFEGLEHHVFEDARRAARMRGGLHPFDDPRFVGASVLVVNANFGCGSSREHAPQALRRSGVRAIVGESFGEIFAGNCVAVGIPCLRVGAQAVRRLQDHCEAAPSSALRLDLTAMTIEMADAIFTAEMPAGSRQQLIDGSWDSLSVLLFAADKTREKVKALGSAAYQLPFSV